MACDIHTYFEVKIKGIWHCYAPVQIDRYYPLFSYMGLTTRNEWGIEPIVPLRGLPSDLSISTQLNYDYAAPDFHSEGWFGISELKQLRKIVVNMWTWEKAHDRFRCWVFSEWVLDYFYDEWKDITLPADIEDVRLVFWFDN